MLADYSVNDYSENELKLIKHYDKLRLIAYIDPPSLYRGMAMEAFISNDQSPYAEVLRKCVSALSTVKVYRKTPGWEAFFKDLS